jgi:hypothetical protein
MGQPQGNVTPNPDGTMPPLPSAGTNVASAAPPAGTAPQTLGDKLGSAIFGPDLAGDLKSQFGANSDPKSTGNQALGLLKGAFGGGGNSDEAMAAFNRDAATIQPSSISVDDSAQRMQAGQQLMASLMAARKRPTPGAGIRMGV